MIRRAGCALLLVVGLAGGARAQQLDLSSGGPIDITAKGGFEFDENQHTVTATTDAHLVRGDVTVLADRMLARYRKKAGADSPTTTGGQPAAATTQPAGSTPAAQPGGLGEADTGGTEVYRVEADGHVRIFTPTDEAVGDHAVYDIDQAVLVMRGQGLKVTTPTQVLTARDSIEYWSQKHMAVARGDAVVVTSDARRIAADVLVGYTTEGQPAATSATAPAATPVAANAPPKPPADPMAASGKLQRVEAFGNVEVRTVTDIARGDRAVYLPDTGMARLVGHVRITRGQEQVNGAAADVNMKTGIAHLVSDPGQRVHGVILPNDPANKANPDPSVPRGSPTAPGPAPAAARP